MPVAPPSDEDVLELLGLPQGGEGGVQLRRSAYRYATSAPLEEIRVRRGEHEEPPLILKDLSRGRLIGDAAGKPEFLHDPRREIETYRKILAPARLGPRFVAAGSAGDPPHHWLVIERVDGVELWQIGEPEPWLASARWLGAMHSRFSGRGEALREANPHLLEHSRTWFAFWGDRAESALRASEDPRAPALAEALAGYDVIVERLATLPVTLLHGEFYPANVLVEPGGGVERIRPVDWEMAALGPGLIDLAALTGGWDESFGLSLLDAYLAGAGAGERDAEVVSDLARCRLYMALQWIGWAPDWRPPREHAHDWLDDALALSRELGLA